MDYDEMLMLRGGLSNLDGDEILHVHCDFVEAVDRFRKRSKLKCVLAASQDGFIKARSFEIGNQSLNHKEWIQRTPSIQSAFSSSDFPIGNLTISCDPVFGFFHLSRISDDLVLIVLMDEETQFQEIERRLVVTAYELEDLWATELRLMQEFSSKIETPVSPASGSAPASPAHIGIKKR